MESITGKKIFNLQIHVRFSKPHFHTDLALKSMGK